MDPFRKVLREINFTLGNISIFDKILDSVIVFLVCFLILILVKFYPILALVPALAYLSIAPIKRIKKLKKQKANIVEASYPPLKEKLRTAVDNVQVSNPVVEALQREVISDVRNVRISSFISGRITSYKILISILMCFIILFVSANDFGIDIKDLAEKGRRLVDAAYVIGGDELGDQLGDIMAATGGTELDDIYGEESRANLGNEIIDVELRPISYEIDVRNVKDVEETEFDETILDETCADEGACTPQESFRNDYPKEQQELVKNYFLKISK